MSARLSRRSLLAGLAAMPTLAIMGCEDDRTEAAPISTVDTLSFDNRLRIPALAESTVDDNGVRTFRLAVVAGSVEFLSGLSTPTWGYTDGRYDAGYLGPTLRATRGERVRVMVENRLSEITTVHWQPWTWPWRCPRPPGPPLAVVAVVTADEHDRGGHDHRPLSS